MKRIIFTVLALLILGSPESFGQAIYSYGANAYYGAVFRYRQDMPNINFTNLHGAEVFFNKQTNGSRHWETMYNYPRLGVSAAYFNYGVPQELGKVYLANGYLDFTFSQKKYNLFRMNLGTGLVYSDVIYDRETNPGNKAIGAPISFILSGTFYYHHRINEHWRLNLNVAFRHFSNGRSNMPNNGMNFPIVGVGLEYYPTEAINFLDSEKSDFDDKYHLNIFGATGWREVLAEDHKHQVFTISTYLSKRLSWYNSVLFGVDGFYYTPESIQKHLAVDGYKVELSTIDGRQMGLTLGHELHFGRVALITQAGIYLYLPHRVWESWYQRYGLKYTFTKDVFLQVSLKSHTRTANMIEWGAGLSF